MMRGRARAGRRTATLLGIGGAVCIACGSGEPIPQDQASSGLATAREGSVNQAPVIRSLHIEPAQPSIDDSVRAVASVADAEGHPIELSYRWSIDGEEVQTSGAELDLSRASTGSGISVTVVANDGKSDSEPRTADAWVIDRPPVINGIAIQPPQKVYPGDTIVVTPTATDPDGDMVEFRFEWFVNDQPASGTSHSFSSEGLKQGDRIRVRVVARDGRNDSRPVESEDVLVGSAHPEIVSTPPGVTDAGVFRYPVEARDPDGDKNLRFRLSEAPDGMRIDSVLGVIEWRPGARQTGVHPVSVVVSDSSRLETTQRFEVTVSDTPPAAAAPAPAAAPEDE